MKILFISSFLLFNETRFGGSKRLYYFAKSLDKNHDLSIIMFDGCKECDAYKNSESRFAKTLIIKADKIRNKFSLPWDLSQDIKKNTYKMDIFLSNTSFDAVLIAYPLALSVIHTLPKRILQKASYLEDDLLIPGTIKELKKLKNSFRKIIKYIRIIQMKFLYHKNLKNISNFLFISEQEKEIGKSLFPRLKPHIIGYGISLDDFNFISDKKLTPVLGYIGNYLHLPNKDAVEHFISEIFPIIVRDIPQVSVVIAGKNMPDSWFLPNHHPPSIAFVKDVENLNYFYRDIDIFINPIISGRGMRTKLIESAACGVPIVSTKLGAEGLDNLKIELAETGKDFSDKIKRLYLNKKLYSEIALNNRTCVEKNYSIDFVGKMLELILQE